MSSIAIKVENLSKAYQLGDIGTGTISRDLERWYARIRGKEDPFLKVGETNDRAIKGANDVVWSLKDINLEIEQGDAVGIIGRNGAGKSTLLKILSKVTAPTTGRISGKGRIASLLEVGTGFHPELSGRENIFLNGAILGMRKKEIQRKLEEIVDFAGIERYLDTPVKRYSSGMYVRLAFAVAAHLESEILIVDEVLAVGDAEFQKKCLGKMGEVSKGEGRTVLFVSHNTISISQLCKKGVFIEKGILKSYGEIHDVIKRYAEDHKELLMGTIEHYAQVDSEYLIIHSISVNNSRMPTFSIQENTIRICLEGRILSPFKGNIEVRIFTNEGLPVLFFSPGHLNDDLIIFEAGEFRFEEVLAFPKNITNGRFSMSIMLSHPNVMTYLNVENILFDNFQIFTSTGRSLDYNDVGFNILNKHAESQSHK
ncbi:ABC transporter ATP-binding protein [Pedobacter sp. AW1-32]|uniref:ABC transporter ATP-binding protein n=1 Tax=Pedobacter sp. AW1-32 TaxID=3383026 RepID=UPI003FF0212F